MSCDLGKALLILKDFRRFTNVTAHSPNLPFLHLRHNSFSNPSSASATSQDFHLRHLESRSCLVAVVIVMVVKVKVFPFTHAMKANWGCGCKDPHIHSNGIRKRQGG